MASPAEVRLTATKAKKRTTKVCMTKGKMGKKRVEKI
jgi:hypothetical protein